jgi:hypothetical protein
LKRMIILVASVVAGASLAGPASAIELDIPDSMVVPDHPYFDERSCADSEHFDADKTRVEIEYLKKSLAPDADPNAYSDTRERREMKLYFDNEMMNPIYGCVRFSAAELEHYLQIKEQTKAAKEEDDRQQSAGRLKSFYAKMRNEHLECFNNPQINKNYTGRWGCFSSLDDDGVIVGIEREAKIAYTECLVAAAKGEAFGGMPNVQQQRQECFDIVGKNTKKKGLGPAIRDARA